MIQWEYITRLVLKSSMPIGSGNEQDYLNDYGSKGWQLCAIYVDKEDTLYYFKRQITENK